MTMIENGQLILSNLAALNPPSRGSLARWLQQTLQRHEPTFLEDCVNKQLTANAERAEQRRKGEKPGRKAPLAGVVKGPRGPLYDAFFTIIKAGVMAHHQSRAVREGITVKGLHDFQVTLTERDFIDPFTVLDGSGTDVDLHAEADLLYLSRLASESAMAFEGEKVKTRIEVAEDKESTFAHAEVDLIPPALRLDAALQGVTLPFSTNRQALAEAAKLISDDHTRNAVLGCLDEQDTLADRVRMYVGHGREPLFRVRQSLRATPYRPYTPTAQAKDLPGVEDSASPLAGWSAFDLSSTERAIMESTQPSIISHSAYQRMLARLAKLQQQYQELLIDMERALEDGDLSESAFYDETRNALQQNQHDTAALQEEIGRVQPGDVAGQVGRIFILQMAGRQCTVQLVDGDAAFGQVSLKSNLGQQLATATTQQVLTVESVKSTLKRTYDYVLQKSGISSQHVEVPNGITRPVLPLVLPTYKWRRIRVSQAVEQRQSQQVIISCIRDPYHAKKAKTVDIRRPPQRQRA